MHKEQDQGRAGLFTRTVRRAPKLKASLKRLANKVGYDTTDWVRVVMYRDSFEFIRKLNPSDLSVLEISGGGQWETNFDFKSYRATQYPDYDVCERPLDDKFDLIIADQIFEHLADPVAAGRNIYQMLKPGGYFINSAPFMIRVHGSPYDYSRWTEIGFRHMLKNAGFSDEQITTNSWGNRACVKANLNKWANRGFFGSLKNEPNFPVMVWAFARREEA